MQPMLRISKTNVSLIPRGPHMREKPQATTGFIRLDAIDQMTGGIAHDFNSLLTVIVGNLELLEMRDPNARQAPVPSLCCDA